MADSTDQLQGDLATGRESGAWWTVLAVQVLLVSVILALHYNDVIEYLVYEWVHNGDWSHGFIIPLFSLYYLYTQRDRIPLQLRSGGLLPRVVGAGLILLGFAIYLKCTYILMVYPKTVSLVITIMGVVLMCCGWPLARWSWFAVAFLFFALPLPTRLYGQITLPLRELAAGVSAAMLSMMSDVEAEGRGAVVEYFYNGKLDRLDVEQACAGMRLMMTMTALGVAMAFIHERPIWQRLTMILACVPIAIFCNIIRVTTTGFLVVFDHGEYARGMYHTLLGLSMLVIAFALYGALSYILNHLLVDADSDSEPVAAATGGLTV